MDDNRHGPQGHAPVSPAPGTAVRTRRATDRPLPHGRTWGGREAAVLACVAAAGILLVLRPDLFSGLVERAVALRARLVG
ncbi:hypothetical protein CP973_20385 [Streptomyces albofaciens JCM 4342]|uniref:hypothetical protein n=1 Tax=Streptomyces albofaciens TaxID=66866 RepID=UPI00123A6E5A|nr:hypothetical protein [Streptomyces albofaciens]KAA6223964.1 hypothetical protein CP973_20385 [Streptomyces albofaciens JCM 4342]